MMSVEPPGAKGTMTRIACDGYVSACAPVTATLAAPSRVRLAPRIWNFFMKTSLTAEKAAPARVRAANDKTKLAGGETYRDKGQ